VASFIDPLIAFVSTNAWLAYLTIFLAALLEAVPVVGSVIPGSTIILALSALVPGGTAATVNVRNPYEGNAYAISEGQRLFDWYNCSGCHGLSGTGANGGPTLVGKTDRDAVLKQVRDGGGGMPAFKGSLSEKEIQDVASYVTDRIAKSGG